MNCSKCGDNVYKLYEVSYIIQNMNASCIEDFEDSKVIDSELCIDCARGTMS